MLNEREMKYRISLRSGSRDPDCKLWNGDCIYSWNIEKESESISGDRKTLIKVKNALLVAHPVNSNKNAL